MENSARGYSRTSSLVDLFQRFVQITLVNELTGLRQRSFRTRLFSVDSDIIFQSFYRNLAVESPEATLCVNRPALAAGSRRELHLFGQKVDGSFSVFMEPAQRLHHLAHETYHHGAIFFRPTSSRRNNI